MPETRYDDRGDRELVRSGARDLPDKPNLQQEQRFRAIGTTATRRKAFIIFTWRGDLVRPISARYMHKEEVALYEKSYPDVQDR